MRAFPEASEEIEFEAAKREEVYDWVTRTLCEQEYWKQRVARLDLIRSDNLKQS